VAKAAIIRLDLAMKEIMENSPWGQKT
jgi:hypothetical protein